MRLTRHLGKALNMKKDHSHTYTRACVHTHTRVRTHNIDRKCMLILILLNCATTLSQAWVSKLLILYHLTFKATLEGKYFYLHVTDEENEL